MKHKKILGIIERAKHIKKTTACGFEFKTRYVGFTANYVFMYVVVLDEEENEQTYRIYLNHRDKKYFKERIDGKGWRSFSASVDKLNNGSLKMIVDSHMYM